MPSFWDDLTNTLNPTSSSRRDSRGYSSRRSYSSRSSRAAPRSGLLATTRRFFRRLYDYMRRNPLKVFMLVIMPLLTSGALATLMARFGVRLPRGLEGMLGGQRAGAGQRYYSRGGARDFGGGNALPGMMGGGLGGSLGGLMKLASGFL